MPDRYGERPDPQLGDYGPTDELPHYGPTDAEIRLAAIQACSLCDPDGYRGSYVCDHTDHTPAARHGIAAIRAQMGWNDQPPQPTPQNPATDQPGTQTTPL